MTAFLTAAMPLPKSTPSSRPVTCTRRCKFSRRISVSPFEVVTLANDPSVAVRPDAADQQSIAHSIERGPTLIGKANTNCIGPVIQHQRRRGRFAFQDSRSVDCHFFFGKSGARRHHWIHLIMSLTARLSCFPLRSDTSTTPFTFPIASATLGPVSFKSFPSCENNLMTTRLRLAGEVPDHVLQELNELDLGRRFLAFNL